MAPPAAIQGQANPVVRGVGIGFQPGRERLPDAVRAEQEQQGRFGGVRDTAWKPFPPRDIRFTTKGKALSAIAMEWPEDGKLVVNSLANGTPKPRSVSLLGNRGNPK